MKNNPLPHMASIIGREMSALSFRRCLGVSSPPTHLFSYIQQTPLHVFLPFSFLQEESQICKKLNRNKKVSAAKNDRSSKCLNIIISTTLLAWVIQTQAWTALPLTITKEGMTSFDWGIISATNGIVIIVVQPFRQPRYLYLRREKKFWLQVASSWDRVYGCTDIFHTIWIHYSDNQYGPQENHLLRRRLQCWCLHSPRLMKEESGWASRQPHFLLQVLWDPRAEAGLFKKNSIRSYGFPVELEGSSRQSWPCRLRFRNR